MKDSPFINDYFNYFQQSAYGVFLSIEDDGPGLEDKFIREIFTRGKRFDEKRPGSGLGLSIVRDTVNLYGGDVEVQNSKKKGKGLTVSLTLPVEFSKP